MSLLSAWRNHKLRNISEPATICLQHLPGWGLPYTADAVYAFADVHLLIPQEQRKNNRKNNLGFPLAKLKQSQGRCPVQLALEIIPLEGLPFPGRKAESPKNLCISSATHQTTVTAAALPRDTV